MTHGESFETCEDPTCVERRQIGNAEQPAENPSFEGIAPLRWQEHAKEHDPKTCTFWACVRNREVEAHNTPVSMLTLEGHTVENCTRCQVLETYMAGHPIDVHRSDGEVCYHGRATWSAGTCTADHFIVETLSPVEVVGHEPAPVKPKSHKGTYDSGKDLVSHYNQVWGPNAYAPRHRGGPRA